MAKNQTLSGKENEFLKAFTEFCEASEPLPRETILREQYPGIEYPLSEIWSSSDERAPYDLDKKEMIKHTIAALNEASNICQGILAKTTSTTLDEVDAYNRAMKNAVFRTEALLNELGYDYPLPTEKRYRCTRSHKSLQTFLPELLCNTEDCIIIRLPNMPASGHSVNNLLFAELSDLLLNNDFSRFEKWHCDFVHVFPRDRTSGVRDVDNYPYKPVIDALVRALHSRDDEDNFSCSMFNYFCDTIKTGCYIRITKQDEKVGFFANFERQISSLNIPQTP